MGSGVQALEGALRHDRRVIIGGLGLAVAASWIYLLTGGGMPEDVSPGMPASWTPSYFALMLVMWWVMMTAMMLPSAAPTILLFAVLNRRLAQHNHPAVPAGLFAAAYVVVWGGFGLLASLAQMQLDALSLLNTATQSASVTIGGVLLVAAGAYQMTPLKYACLRHCRAPIQFFGRRFRKGRAGAFLMGLEHGLYCLGCCWVMMGLLFYAGVMNLAWIIGLALYVLLEKLAPAGHRISRWAGSVLIVWGIWVLAAGWTSLGTSYM